MKTLAVLQPGYLPWLGFFEQLYRSDAFVFYDDIQFDKHGWRNRNRIKTPQGPLWLTVPVLHKGLDKPRILDVEIDPSQRNWAKKHLASIEQNYARAPFKDPFLAELAPILRQPWGRLVDLDIAVIELMAKWLGIDRPLHRSSELGIQGEKTERLVKFCKHFGADHYFSGSAARSYLDVEAFKKEGVEVLWQDYPHPVYPQLHGPFTPYLSTLDLIMNVGYGGLPILLNRDHAESGTYSRDYDPETEEGSIAL